MIDLCGCQITLSSCWCANDRWGPLLGPNKAFDPTRFFIFCANVIGSPYGTVSSVTLNPDTGKPYGPEMPGSSVKDDVR